MTLLIIALYFSYGPCQTPTLGFCVQRYLQINTFKPEKFWSLQPYIIQSGYEILLEWQRSKLFDINVNISILSNHQFLSFELTKDVCLIVLCLFRLL